VGSSPPRTAAHWRPYTNALGLWWFDLGTGSIAGQQWAVTIKLAGQQTLSVTIAPTGLDQGFPGALQPVRQEQDV
jgi:hypothetical protein